MHSLLHLEYARATDADRVRGHADRAVRRTTWPQAPPGRLRPLVARLLGRAAGRIDRESARRAVA